MAVSTDRRRSGSPARPRTAGPHRSRIQWLLVWLMCVGVASASACTQGEADPVEAPREQAADPKPTAPPATKPALDADAPTPTATPSPRPTPPVSMIAGGSIVALDQMLTLVPADTAWVWASLGEGATGESPDEGGAAVRLEDFSDFYDSFANALAAELDADDPLDRIARSVLDELRGHYDAAGLRELGVAETPRLVVHALGIAPVLRVELADAAATDAALERIERRADLPSRRATFEGVPYRQWESGPWTLVVALAPDLLIAAVLPTATVDASLPILFGKAPPAESLAAAGTLDQLAARHEGAGQARGAGFVSLPRLGDALGLESAELIAAVARYLDVPGSMADGCVADLQRLTSLVARVAFVAGDDADAQWGSVFIELASPEPLERLRALRSDEVAGLGRHPWAGGHTPDGMPLPGAWLGIGLDMPGLGVWLAELAEVVKTQPFACTSLVNLNELLGATKSWWMQLPLGVRQANGLFALATDASLSPRRGLKSIEGVVVLGSRAPRRLWDDMVAGTRWASRLSTHRVKELDDSPPLATFSSVTARVIDGALVLTSGQGVDLEAEALVGLAQANEDIGDEDEPARDDGPPNTLIAELGYDYGRLMSVYFKDASTGTDAETLADASTREAVMRYGLLRLELHLLDDALRLDYRLELRPRPPLPAAPASPPEGEE